MKKRIIVLGCTGSIGKSTLELVREFPDLFEVVGLQAHSNEKQLLDLGKEFSCTQLCLTGKNIGADVLNSRIISETLYRNKCIIMKYYCFKLFKLINMRYFTYKIP